MIFKLNIKPIKINAGNKSELMAKIERSTYSLSFGTYGDNVLKTKSGHMRVYNIQKVRKKTTQVKDPKKAKFNTKSKIVRNGHWIGYYYDIPEEVARITGIKLVQEKRNFTIQKAK